jgi:hypothetical protein
MISWLLNHQTLLFYSSTIKSIVNIRVEINKRKDKWA